MKINYTKSLTMEEYIDEFIKEPNLLKFYSRADFRFSDGTLMGAWFFNKGSKILDSNEIKNRTIKLQLLQFINMYEEFIEVLKIGRIVVNSLEIKCIYFNDLNDREFAELLNERFTILYNGYFRKEDYNEEEKFMHTLIRFLKRKNSEKFNKDANITFEGQPKFNMARWFEENKEKILSYEGVLGELARKQYEAYQNGNCIDVGSINKGSKQY